MANISKQMNILLTCVNGIGNLMSSINIVHFRRLNTSFYLRLLGTGHYLCPGMGWRKLWGLRNFSGLTRGGGGGREKNLLFERGFEN